jgi:hypothetical protein
VACDAGEVRRATWTRTTWARRNCRADVGEHSTEPLYVSLTLDILLWLPQLAAPTCHGLYEHELYTCTVKTSKAVCYFFFNARAGKSYRGIVS